MDQEYAAQTPLDEMVSSETSQMLKASLPYLPPKAQQFLSIYLKTKELQNTAAMFSSRNMKQQQIQAAELPVTDPTEMLQDLRRFCGPKSRRKMDELLNVLTMAQMFQIMNEHPDEKGEDL